MNDQKTKRNIAEGVLEKISEEHLKPKPKWEFILQNTYFWILGITTIILGALSISALLFVFKNIKWEFYEATHNNLFTFMIEFLPYMWIVTFLLLLYFTHCLIRKTKHGYKYHLYIVAGGILSISIILGMIFATFGFGKVIDKNFGNKIPFHHDIEMKNNLLWNNPEKGLLIGNISIFDDEIALISPEGKVWNLITDHLNENDLEILNSEEKIRIIGLIKENSFYVCGVLPSNGMVSEKIGEEIIERKKFLERNKECEGLRPYRKLLLK